MTLRVLRIGLVRDGRIVEERLIRPGQAVSVGQSTRNDFVLPPTHLEQHFQLFRPTRDGGYALRLSGDMDGKLSFGDAVQPLKTLRDTQGRRVDDGWELLLPPRSRGKVVIDGVTVLFQFVPAPPEPARVVTSFRPKLWEDDDPVYFGFLGLNAALATLAMIYVYTRPPVNDLVVPEIPDRVLQFALQTPDVEEPPEEPAVDPDAPPTLTDEPSPPDEVADRIDQPADPPPTPQPGGGARDPDEVLADAIEDSALMRALMIGTTGDANNGERIEDLLGPGGRYTDLDAFVQEGREVVVYNDGPTFRQGNGTGDRRDADMGQLQDATIGDVGLGDGPGGGTPTGDIFTPGPVEDPPSSRTVAAVIRAHSGQLKACYEAERKINPDTGGRLVVWFEIHEDGAVVEATVLDNETGSNGAFEACVTRRFSRWTFAAEDAGVHTYPLVFTPT